MQTAKVKGTYYQADSFLGRKKIHQDIDAFSVGCVVTLH
jgi:hypothetical protein